MKNKRLAYLLAPLVLLVWGLIAQRIWSAASADAPDAAPEQSSPATARVVDHLRRPVLLLTYGDPFQGLPASRLLPVAASSVNNAGVAEGTRYHAVAAPALNLPIITPVAAAPVVWPQVKYLGLIANSGGRNQVALLAIDNQEVIVKTGKSSHGIQVVKVFRDSVQLSFDKQRKSFPRNTL